MINRDIDYDGSGGGIITSDPSHEGIVRRKYPKAYVRRTIGKKPNRFVYQIRLKTGFFKSEPLGDKHYFIDQAWTSAYKKI